MPTPLRKAAGLRPAVPVRVEQAPDDWLCTWSYRELARSPGEPRKGFWELKYINAACLEHARLAAA